LDFPFYDFSVIYYDFSKLLQEVICPVRIEVMVFCLLEKLPMSFLGIFPFKGTGNK
jgi:hypothetical protein